LEMRYIEGKLMRCENIQHALTKRRDEGSSHVIG